MLTVILQHQSCMQDLERRASRSPATFLPGLVESSSTEPYTTHMYAARRLYGNVVCTYVVGAIVKLAYRRVISLSLATFCGLQCASALSSPAAQIRARSMGCGAKPVGL
jgi:hypothetical protein